MKTFLPRLLISMIGMMIFSNDISASCKIIDSSWSSNSTECKDTFIHGEATAYHANGKLKYTGDFENGNMVSGTIFYKNKPFFVGAIVDKEMHGSGICFFKGKPESCEYFKGERIDTIYKLRFLMKKQLQAIKMLLDAQSNLQLSRQTTYQQPPQYQQEYAPEQSAGNPLTDKAANIVLDTLINQFF